MAEVFRLTPPSEPNPDPIDFEDFWTLWPKERRVEKKAAREAWYCIDPCTQVVVLERLCEWRKFWKERSQWEYVPHPHRWLRGERWEDEIPGHTHLCHAPAKLPQAAPKSSMPDAVRQMIASLRLKR